MDVLRYTISYTTDADASTILAYRGNTCISHSPTPILLVLLYEGYSVGGMDVQHLRHIASIGTSPIYSTGRHSPIQC